MNVQARYDFWIELFGEREKVQQLNQIAPEALSLIQGSIIVDVLVRLARLFDRPATGKYQNASLMRLVETYGLPRDATRSARVRKILDQSPIEQLKIARDKSLSHSDLETAIDGSYLPGFKHGMTRGLIKAAQDILNEVAVDLGGAHTHWDEPSSKRWATRFLRRLDDGQRLANERRWLRKCLIEGIDNGDPTAMDQLIAVGGVKGLRA